MITPPSVRQGDTIGIIAPARSVSMKEIEPFIIWATSQGFKIKLGKNVFKQYHQFAGNDKQRLRDIEMMLSDDKVKAVFAARGGYGCGRLLKELNVRLFADNPKWIAGFSDVTAIMAAINRHAGIETLHTLMPFSLYSHDDFDPESLESLMKGLTGQKLTYRILPHNLNITGSAKGILTGGNLSVLYSLAGTPYEPQYKERILLLEDVDEYLYHIDRMILNFELRGVFEEISGLIVGSFNSMNDNTVSFGKRAYEIIAERAYKHNLTTLFGFPAGHENRNHTLIFGREVTLTVGEDYTELDFPG